MKKLFILAALALLMSCATQETRSKYTYDWVIVLKEGSYAVGDATSREQAAALMDDWAKGRVEKKRLIKTVYVRHRR